MDFNVVDKPILKKEGGKNKNQELIDAISNLPSGKAISFTFQNYKGALDKRNSSGMILRKVGIKISTNIIPNKSQYILYISKKE
jgi:thymidine kinase